MKLVTQSPLPAAQRLYGYLCELPKEYILAGQQESPARGREEFEIDYIRHVTGELPAIRGLDYIHDDFAGVNRRAADWFKIGGIVSICRHWGAPPYGLGYPSSQTRADVRGILDEKTVIHKAALAQIDKAGLALRELQDAGVPVLWRPFHEFDGAWFWWGMDGGESFISLWRLLFERLNGYWGLKNLIWVLGYADEVTDGWYPGDGFADIIGSDTYKYGIHAEGYRKCLRVTDKRMPAALHECGHVPDPAALRESGTYWRWFLPWHSRHLTDHNSELYLSRVYADEFTVKIRNLPRFG